MKDKNLDRIAAFEKAIAEKYGSEAVQNPRANWDETKEEEYLQQMKEFYQKTQQNEACGCRIFEYSQSPEFRFQHGAPCYKAKQETPARIDSTTPQRSSRDSQEEKF